MAFPSASEVPTTSPSHGSTSGGHVESYGAYRRKRYVLYHPRLHQPIIMLFNKVNALHGFSKNNAADQPSSGRMLEMCGGENP